MAKVPNNYTYEDIEASPYGLRGASIEELQEAIKHEQWEIMSYKDTLKKWSGSKSVYFKNTRDALASSQGRVKELRELIKEKRKFKTARKKQ